MSKHTPGPWIAVHFSTSQQLDCFEVAEISDMRVIPKQGGWPKAGLPENDARLIAAAPELYEVAQAIIDAMTASQSLHGVLLFGIAQRARAAIAKATGEQQ